MIIKLAKGSSDDWSGYSRELLSQYEEKWVEVKGYPDRSHVSICIDGTSLHIPIRYISEVINDNRDEYEYCTYCGKTQKKDIDECHYCSHSRSYLKPLMAGSKKMGCEQIMKDCIAKVFH